MNLMKGLSYFTLSLLISQCAAQETIGFEPTARSVLDTAPYWTMVLAKGFTTDGVIQGFNVYTQFPTSQRPLILGLYRPVAGVACKFTLLKYWKPDIAATNTVTKITFSGSDQFEYKAGDTVGYTWTNYGIIPFDYVGPQNYCEDAQQFTTVGGAVPLVANRYGGRAYSFQVITGPATACSSGPCQNGGACVLAGSNSYTCTCAAGFEGTNCEKSYMCSGSTDLSSAKSIGYDATNRGVLDSAGTWTMVLKQGFTTDGVLQGLRFYIGAVRPALFGLYRPVSGCTFTLIKSWAPSITATGQITITFTGSDIVNFKAGDTIGYTWTSTGSVPFDYVGGQNYCEDAQNQVAVGSNVALVDNRYGNRAYSFQGLFDQSSPVTLNYCVPNPCLNGGNCCSTDKSYQCTCPAGTNPPNCVRPDPCDSAPCNNCGKCSKNGDSFTCKCNTGFSGATCDTVVPDPCDNNPCKNGGECIRADNTRYVCLCAKGYTGSSCQTTIANPCDKKPCANGGICSREGETDYSCSCPKGYSGDTCQTVSDPCASSPCKNGAGCTKSGSSFTCQCAAGYSGSNCEKESDPCASSPCKNGAGCTKSGSSFTCQCAAGYSGSNCEKASGACANSPCQNGGTCVPNGASDYDCICTADYDDGEDCSTYQDPCSSSPCLNGGKCKRLSGLTYQCTCVGDYVGTYCELKKGTDPCSNKPCKNGGTCSTTTPTTYSCKCPKRYEGQMCEKVVCLTEASPTACAGLPFGKYAYCNNCSNWVACKAKKQKLKSCAKRAPNVNYDRSTRTCTADQKTACAGLS